MSDTAASLQRCTPLVRSERGVERLVSLIAPHNERSRRVERLGATPAETVELFDSGPAVVWIHP